MGQVIFRTLLSDFITPAPLRLRVKFRVFCVSSIRLRPGVLRSVEYCANLENISFRPGNRQIDEALVIYYK